MKITSCPTREEISDAFDVLERQFLHVYQLLYVNKLASPYGNPLNVSRKLNRQLEPMIYIKVELWRPEKGLDFCVIGTETDEEILHKASMLIEGQGRDLPFRNACCPYAKRISCVCDLAYECELHGTHHIGTHE